MSPGTNNNEKKKKGEETSYSAVSFREKNVQNKTGTSLDSTCTVNSTLSFDDLQLKNSSKSLKSTITINSLTLTYDNGSKYDSSLPAKHNSTRFINNSEKDPKNESIKKSYTAVALLSNNENEHLESFCNLSLINEENKTVQLNCDSLIYEATCSNTLKNNNVIKKNGNNKQDCNSIRKSKVILELSNGTSDKSHVNLSNIKVRKLYDPDEFINENLIQCDDEERKEKRLEENNSKNQDTFRKPNRAALTPILITSKAKQFLDEKSLQFVHSDTKVFEDGNDDTTKDNKDKTKSVNNYDNDEVQTELVSKIRNNNRYNKNCDDVDCSKKIRRSTRASLLQKNCNKLRRSARISSSQLHNHSSSSENIENDEPFIKPVNRRSSLDFQNCLCKQKRLKKYHQKKPTIVCTKMHRQEVEIFTQVVKRIGGFDVEDDVSDKTTHLVIGESKRTINMLRGIARGCWILKQEWIFRSLEENKWLFEEDFEATDFSPAVRQCRLQRQAFGPSYSMDIFQNCGYIYISKSTNPRCSDLRELVSICKGKLTTICRNASIVVGDYVKYSNVTCVSEVWILDSIAFNKLKPLKKYLINSDCC